MSTPLVSVIIPTYNRKEYLDIAINSAIKQTYTNIEVLVIDDGSTHNYAEDLCGKYNNCFYFYKDNGGLSSARNFGIKKAKGDFVAFLDDDDFWKLNKIEKQVEIITKHPEVDLIHSSALVVNENGEPTGKVIGASNKKVSKRSGKVFWNALGTWVVKSPTPLIRKSVFTKDLLFDETILIGEDVDFYQRLFYRHQVYYIDEPLAYYRDFGDEKRLSKQRSKYIGLEVKMIENFKRMGVSNIFLLNKIARKLIIQAIRNWNLAFPNQKKKKNNIKYYLSPITYLKTGFNKT